MNELILDKDDLLFVAADRSLLQAELAGREALASALGAMVPQNWPPQFINDETVAFTLQQMTANPEPVGWWSWYILWEEPDTEAPVLIGVIGFKGQPDAARQVELGYSLLQEYQGRGLASRAVRYLARWAFEQGVEAVIAETLPSLPASIRVLEKTGFQPAGPGSEEGVLRFSLSREHAFTGN